MREAIGPEELTELAPIMGGDDFSAYLAEAPGCYAFIGAGGEDAPIPHHHPRFRIDERALATGVRLHVHVALRALEEVPMKVQHVLAALPFVGILVGMFFANRVEPYVLGLPFAMFWVVIWVVLAALIMAVVYRLDTR